MSNKTDIDQARDAYADAMDTRCFQAPVRAPATTPTVPAWCLDVVIAELDRVRDAASPDYVRVPRAQFECLERRNVYACEAGLALDMIIPERAFELPARVRALVEAHAALRAALRTLVESPCPMPIRSSTVRYK